MRTMKKLATLLLAVCLMVPCFSMVGYAANRIMFEDPTTKVGQTLELKGVIVADSNLEDRTIDMTYDTSMLKFQSGDNVTETAAGKLRYEVKGQQSGTRVEFKMSFTVLKEGTTSVQVADYTIFSTSDAKLTCDRGSSSIKIEAGDPSAVTPAEPTGNTTGTSVEIDGETYIISADFKESDIPKGFKEATLDYANAEHKAVTQEETGLYLAYLVNENAEGTFFLYVEENATFAPFKQISISDTTDIVLLSYVEDIVFPEPYVETTVEVNGLSFPAWQSSEDTDNCVIYAMNNRGEKSFYQFDTVESTYQRFDLPVVEEEEEDDSLIGTLSTVLGEHMDMVVLGVGIGFIIFLIVVIVLSVKLYNRNAELDELYDEYGIDLLDDELTKKDNNVVRINDETDLDEIDYETEDDIVIAGLEEAEETTQDELVEEAQKETSETEPFHVASSPVELFAEESEELPVNSEVTNLHKEVDDTEDLDAAIKTVAEAVKSDEDYWSDDETDFEMNFIDLDD